jgi:hypothetical protein
MKKGLLVLLVSLLFLIIASPTGAHVGGVPFLKINGQYSPANAAYFSNPNLKPELPQDMGPEKYLVNTPIEFEIDKSSIPLPKDQVEEATFRWSFERGNTDYQFGLKLTHTYSQIGSHFITLDVKAANQDTFTPYDQIQVDVVSDLNYSLPAAKITVSAKQLNSGQPLTFQADISANQGNSISDYYWFVENQKIPNQPSLTQTFNDDDFFTLVYLGYTDNLGFSGHRAVWIEGVKGEISFPFPPNSRDELNINANSATLPGIPSFNTLIPLLIVAVPLVLVIGVLVRRRETDLP